MVNNPMIASIKDLPFEIIDCEFIVITHKFGDYLFSDDECYKGDRQLSMIRCSNSNGYKINGKFKSLTWLKAQQKIIKNSEARAKKYGLHKNNRH